jgi:hypothetical protein
MRRDEIRIFPGNVATHITRLQHLDKTDAPLATEAPAPPASPTPPEPLDYISPTALRPSRQRLARIIANLAASAVLAISFFIIILAWWNDWEGFTVVLFRAAVVFSVPVLWLAYNGIASLCRLRR